MGKQKRSENTYQKIQTVFKRDVKNVIMPYGELTDPAFEFLRDKKWRGEEKVDGTNIRLEVTSEIVRSEPSDEGTIQTLGVAFAVEYKGKKAYENELIKTDFDKKKLYDLLVSCGFELGSYSAFLSDVCARLNKNTASLTTSGIKTKFSIKPYLLSQTTRFFP